MKRVILLFAAVLVASIGWSQTMTVTLEDGSTVKYDMNKVKSIDFTDDDSGNNQESTPSIVGTWKLMSCSGEGLVENGGNWVVSFLFNYLQLKADGHFILVKAKNASSPIEISKGSWRRIENTLAIQPEPGVSQNYVIIEFESNKLSLLDGFKVIGHYERVSDSEIEKYLNN